jgi:hypothetical protein
VLAQCLSHTLVHVVEEDASYSNPVRHVAVRDSIQVTVTVSKERPGGGAMKGEESTSRAIRLHNLPAP